MDINYFKKVDLFTLRKNTNRIYLVDIESNICQSDDITEKFNREESLKNDYFVMYTGHELHPNVTVTLYKVVDRVIDENKNIILFVKEKTETFGKR